MPIALALVAGVAVALTIAGAASPSPDSTAARPIRVAFFASGLANTYVPAQIQGAKSAAGKLGASITVFDAVFDASKQVTQVQDAITSRKFDAFVISAIDGNALVPQIKKAIAAGTRVACISAPCGPGSDVAETAGQGPNRARRPFVRPERAAARATGHRRLWET